MRRRVVLVLATVALAIVLAGGVAQAIINGEPDRGPKAHPYVVADVAWQSAHNLRTLRWEAAFSFVLRSWEAEFWVGVGGCRYNLGSPRLVGWIERDVGRQVLFYQEVCAMPRGKKDSGRNEGARAHGDALPFELPGRGHGH